MFDITKEISKIIQYQFPSFYLREGPELVLFLQTYFEFLEQEKNILDVSRKLQLLRSIDTTRDEYIKFFVKKYMPSIPENLLIDKRFLQKHILDIYRSKGSISGLKLLFRILFNEDVFVYIPSEDILKADDGKWIERKYFEVTKSPMNFNLVNKIVYGSSSGARCIIENFEKRNIFGKEINLLYVSDVFGDFLVGEKLLYENYTQEFEFNEAPIILGSPSSVSLVNFGKDYQKGDVLKQLPSITEGKNLELRVQKTFNGSGFIRFDLIDGGSGYSKDTQIQIIPANNEIGVQADFKILSFKDLETFIYNDKIIEPYLEVELDANNFSANSSDVSELSTANLNTIIQVGLNIQEVQIGTIESIITTNPGKNYQNTVDIILTDPYTSGSLIPDGKGGYLGKNAIVEAELISGNNLVASDGIKVINSGFGFNDDTNILEAQTFENANSVNSNESNNTIEFTVNLSAIGISPGFWKNQDGFIDDSKFLQDDFYYQEYSYEINSSNPLDLYISIIENIFHPAGNEVFGKINLYNVDEIPTIHSGFGFNNFEYYEDYYVNESNNTIEFSVVGNIINTNKKQLPNITPSNWSSTVATFDSDVIKINT